MLLYSPDAPAGWNALPLEVKQKFYDIAGKGDWNAFEAFDHLVPDTLKDNPDEVLTWMDGGELTIETWLGQQGAASVYPEQVTVEIPDRDVSRIISGNNGGEYSVENTIMEDMSVNRARGAQNMTDLEYSSTVDQNAVDIELIENHFESASEAVADVPLEAVGPEFGINVLFDAVLPTIGAYKVGTYVASKCKTTQDKLGWGFLSGGVMALIMASPLGAPIAAGYSGYKLTKFIYNRYHTPAETV